MIFEPYDYFEIHDSIHAKRLSLPDDLEVYQAG